MRSFSFGLLAILAAGSCGVALADTSSGTAWYGMVAESGAWIGHSSEEIAQTADGREVIDSQVIEARDEGDRAAYAPWFSARKAITMSWRTVRKEDRDGRTVSVDAASQNGAEWRNDWARSEAVIADGTARITRTTPAETRVLTIALAPNVRFDSGDGLLASWNPATSPRLEFESFNIEAAAVDHVVIEAVAGAPPDPQGAIAALRKTYQGPQLMAVSRLLIGRDGRIVQATQPMFGITVTIKATDRETALKDHSFYNFIPHLMTKSLYRISSAAKQGHIRYRFGFKDGIEFALPQTGEQRAAAEPGFATIDICADCGPGLPSDAATLADALKPTAWMQSDDPRLKAIADPVAKLAVSDTRKMEILAKKARAILVHLDFAGHYSALETLSRKSGDCTEAATLLAALGRAAGIPTRVADGLVYSREDYHGVSNAFLPHSWTLAWADGKWRSFDSALDSFDSTHIALTVGDGDARSLSAASQLAGLLRWDGIAEVKAQP